MNLSDHLTKAKAQLGNTNTYKAVAKYPTSRPSVFSVLMDQNLDMNYNCLGLDPSLSGRTNINTAQV